MITLNEMNLSVVLDSLDNISADAIVNEVDTHFSFEGEIAEEIINICGEEIKDKCLEKADIPFTIGGAIVTEGGKYKGQVIHVVVAEKGEISDFYNICDAVKHALLIAENLEFNTIVIPAIGYVGGLDLKQGIFTMLEMIQNMVINISFMFLKNIIFCARNEEEYEVFDKYFNELFL